MLRPEVNTKNFLTTTFYLLNIQKFKDPVKPRHRGLGEECTTSVHSFGWVEGSNPGRSSFLYLCESCSS